MRHEPFQGAAPIYVGDDVADEAGFTSAARFGGIGVLVGEPRHSAAHLRIASQKAVWEWLETSLQSGAFTISPPSP